MTVRHIYISDDGEEFDTEEECMEHEKMLDTSNALLMFDEDYNILVNDDPGRAYELSSYLYILDGEKTRPFLQWIESEWGYATPEEVEAGDVYYYDDRACKYIDLNKKIDELCMTRDRIVEQVRDLNADKE